ncbi:MULTISPECIES: NADH-quinone oxidoreductase subunit H [unclassified Thermosipho (in: thermotogales)]|uniref:respiratory chain complex I subunit 1 family protein n=1 Tax=unclassified Thermosipho (in: thermotogales) TaxID=2676525 RepID=UPI000987B066|nr:MULTISPECIES: NADH-quinone oxidoreductase subunit H [unclassified Thermosipho (in: thermotogales)]MBT1247616.1 NADH dehydrogenase [Thermosipho sp. 1244]OOC46148.1 NADH dehydrogenase [Thermosipho sp. 1223]
MTILKVIAVLLTGFFVGLTLEGIARKIMARVQRRYGPPWYQNFIDVFKALSKRGISHGWIFDFGILMALGGVIATLAFVPLGDLVAFPGLDNIFIIVYLFAVGALGMAMGMVGSGNPNASIGVARALTQMLGYELPYLISIAGVLYYYKTSSVSGLMMAQQNTWTLFKMPIGGIVAFISLLGMLGKKPFDTPIAPAEIASGPMVELSAKYMGLLMLMHTFSIFVEIGLFVDIFLGVSNYFTFLLKFTIVWIIATLISSVLPRFRIEQVVKFYWKVPLSLAFVQVLFVLLGWVF